MSQELEKTDGLQIFKDMGVMSECVHITLSEESLSVLERKISEVVVLKFPKGFGFKIPGTIGMYSDSDPLSLFRIPGDPYLLNSIYQLRAQCAIPGSSAASSNEKSDTVIAKANKEYALANTELKYRTEDNPIDPNDKGVEYQANCIYFNDGAGAILGTEIDGKYVSQILDFPIDELKDRKEYERYLDSKRTLIGTTLEGKNVTMTGSIREIKDFCSINRVGVGVLASPAFIQDERVLSEEEVFRNCMLGDPRHFIREPYKNGVVHMGVITEAIRNSRGSEIYRSIKSKLPISLDIPDHLKAFLNEGNIDFIRSAYSEDVVYGPDFASGVSIKNGKLNLPYLNAGCYNHILTGINKEGEMYLVVIPGIVNGASGQDGLSLSEITELSKDLRDKYDLVSLFDSCHGRDPGSLVVLSSNSTIVSEDEELSVLLTGEVSRNNKPSNTSPRYMLGKIIKS